MSERERNGHKQEHKQVEQKNETGSELAQLGVQSDLGRASGNLLAGGGDTSVQGHAAQLSNGNIPIVQRQTMANRIGQIGGNQYLQRVMKEIGSNGPALDEGPSLETEASTASPQVTSAPNIQREEVNGPYEGNRPDPAQASDGFEINSDAARVLQTGDTVTYNVQQVQDMMWRSDSEVTYQWFAENDPAAVEQYGISASVTRGPGSYSWTLSAQVPGLHLIKADVLLDGSQLATVEYEQEVINRNWDFVTVGENITPSPISTIEDFVALVERVEDAYGGIPWQDVTTRLRKEYYPGPGGAYSGLKDAFQWGDLVDEQDEMPALEVPPVAIEDVAALRSTQVININGDEVDIGHLLTGVDSMNFPTVAGIFDAHNMEGPAAATWSGDVGSAMVKYVRKESERIEEIEDDAQRREEYYQGWAGQSDMFGDYDGLAIANLDSLGADAPLSERLWAYYIDSVEEGANQRYHNFCDASQLEYLGNSLSDEAKERIREQISSFADAFDLVDSVKDDIGYSFMDQGYYDSWGFLFGPPPSQQFREEDAIELEEALDWFSNRFIQEVENGLAGESTE